MNRYYIMVSLLLSISLLVPVGPRQKKVDSWIDVSVKQESELRASLVKANVPIISAWIKVKREVVLMSADLTGLDQLVLVTTAGPGDTNWDWGTWTNARLIKADDSSVWLDELDPDYWVSGSGSIRKNADLYRNPLLIGSRRYDHSVLCRTNGAMVYNINKEYVRFEAEVGLANQSAIGSVFFRTMNIFLKEEAACLLATYPKELGALDANIDRLEN